MGKLYVAYQAQVGVPATDPSDIFLQSSTDGGVTWSSRVRVNDDPAGAVQTNPWVAVGPGGVVDVAWWDQRDGYPGATIGDVSFAQSTNGGTSFAPNRRITDPSLNQGTGLYEYLGDDFTTGFDWYGPVLLPLNDGSVLAVWTDSRQGNYDNGFQDIYLSKLSATTSIPTSSIATATPSGLSVVLSCLAYPGGPEAVNGDPVTKLVVANQTDVAGALAGAVLARANWSSLLLSDSTGLSPVAQADAARMVPEGAYVIGDTSTLSPTVSSELLAATRNGENVVRIAPANSVAIADQRADVARQIAELMFPLPGSAPTAVIANPGTPEAVSASALAASLQYPLLYVDTRTSLPGPTSAAIATLGIKKALIIGGTGAVNSGVETQLDNLLGAPNVTRLGGADQYATSQAVATASVNTFHLPDNVVYTADGGRPIDGALLGSAVARLGGLMLLTPGANTATAATTLGTMGLDASTDRIVGVIGTGGTDPTLPPPTQTPASAGPVDLGPGRTAVAISSGGSHTCALLDNGRIRCWGYSAYGQLGYCSTSNVGDVQTPAAAGPVNLQPGDGGVGCANPAPVAPTATTRHRLALTSSRSRCTRSGPRATSTSLRPCATEHAASP